MTEKAPPRTDEPQAAIEAVVVSVNRSMSRTRLAIRQEFGNEPMPDGYTGAFGIFLPPGPVALEPGERVTVNIVLARPSS